MASNKRNSDQGEASVLRELFGPLFPKLVGSLGGTRIYVPVKPKHSFIELCGEDIARIFLLQMPGDAVRVPTSELFCFDLRQKAVMRSYAEGLKKNQIARQLSLSRRCLSEIISLTKSEPTKFVPAQHARIVALAKKGCQAKVIAQEAQCDEGFVLQTLAQANQKVRTPAQPRRQAKSVEFTLRKYDLFNRGQPLNDIAETMDCDVREVVAAVSGKHAHLGQNPARIDLQSRVRILWSAGMSDLDIAIECVETLAETHRQLALCGIVAGNSADAIKSDGHLRRAEAGSGTNMVTRSKSPHSAAEAAFY